MNQIGDRMRERRKELKLSQDAVCGRVALATSGRWNPDWRDMVRIEGGTRIVSDLEMLALAEALECDPSWLFLGK